MRSITIYHRVMFNEDNARVRRCKHLPLVGLIARGMISTYNLPD